MPNGGTASRPATIAGMGISSFEQERELQEMVRCVQMFFGQQRSQTEIAKELGIQQSKVSRLLKKAKDERIYTVEFNLPLRARRGANLINRYGLRDAIVITAGVPKFLKEDLGRAAAEYFERVATDGIRVGLSCGNTLFHFVQHLTGKKATVFKIYPLGAEMNLRILDISFNTLVGMMTAKYSADSEGYWLPPDFDRSGGRKRNAQKNASKGPDVQSIVEQADDVDVAIVGIGELNEKGPGFCELASRHGISMTTLKKLGVVGEFNYQPFDNNGRPVANEKLTPVFSNVRGVTLKRLSELSATHGKLVIAVAGGEKKRDAIRAALAGRLFNVLITDHETADDLLEPEERQELPVA